ncbi:MAG: SsrA-binding protein SmpB [Patescibacteria group bacterium]|nr:SsrA-binding protein SmpB [Patescibacteria group bacterium]
MPTLAQNRHARHDYAILETLEAGIALTGPEVKSAKSGRITLQGSYVRVDRAGQAWLIGCHIAPYPPAGNLRQDPLRERRLLLRRPQLKSLVGTLKQPGLTFLPLSVYTKGSLIKLELAVARGKREYDKRATIKKREVEREIRSRMRRAVR